MNLSGRHALPALPPGGKPGADLSGGWVGSRVILEVFGN